MTFGNLIEALGGKLGIEIEDAGGAAAVETDGTTVVLQDAGELLLLRAEVGEIPADGKETILLSAMEANFLYQGTGGATLAVNHEDGRLHVHKYNWMERLDADTVLEALEKLSRTVAAWRKILADYRPEAEAPGASETGSAPAAGMDFFRDFC